MGFKTFVCSPWIHTVVWFIFAWRSRAEVFANGNHIWPQYISVYFATEEEKGNSKSELLCLKSLGMHSKLQLTESQSLLAWTTFIISWARLWSGVQSLWRGFLTQTYSQPSAPAVLSHPLKGMISFLGNQTSDSITFFLFNQLFFNIFSPWLFSIPQKKQQANLICFSPNKNDTALNPT